MRERNDERWLDRHLRRVVSDSKPAFDAESWKARHREEYATLLARSRQPGRGRVRLLSRRWMAGLAVAAVVILAVGMLLLGRFVHEPEKPTAPSRPVANSAAEMMSMMSLRAAYEQGGFDALDRQLQNTLDEFGPRSSSVSLQELF